MKPIFKIEKDSVHRWQAFLPDLLPKLHDYSLLLDSTEMERAKRFRFDLHRERFILSRAILRQILGLYCELSPKNILFERGPHGKPRLKQDVLQFNVSHSHDWAVYVLTNHTEVGVDIEKIEPHFNEDVAKRFLSETEYAALASLPVSEKNRTFYRLWVGREAIIKMSGLGLYSTLPDFSLDLFQDMQTVSWHYPNKIHSCYLHYFSVDPDYQSAFATCQPVSQIVSWQWTLNGFL